MRGHIQARPGHRFITGDFSSIEGVVNAWQADHFVKMEQFEHQFDGTGPNTYLLAAASIYEKDVAILTKKSAEYPIGKVSELACIAWGQQVLTDRGCVPIQHLRDDMLLWDGEDWVSHGGLVFKGVQEVVDYDGLRATLDHTVFAATGAEMRLSAAMAEDEGLMRTGLGDAALPWIISNRRPVLSARLVGPVRVYDILNAGPRNRFTVSGRLVHNCGYQGGAGAFAKMGKNFNVHVPEEQAMQIVRAWRAANAPIVESWYECQDAAFTSVKSPGQVIPCRNGRFKFFTTPDRTFLWVQMPSGGMLAYARPEIRDVTRKVVRLDPETGKRFEETVVKPAVTFWSVDSVTRKWKRKASYGGTWVENFVQKVARDLLAEAMLRLEDAGYEIVMTAHDEAVAEVPFGFGSLEEFEQIMAQKPAWIGDCPIAVEGWCGPRYRK